MLHLIIALVLLKLLLSGISGGNDISEGRPGITYVPDVLLVLAAAIVVTKELVRGRLSKALFYQLVILLCGAATCLVSGYLNGVEAATEIQAVVKTLFPFLLIAAAGALAQNHRGRVDRLASAVALTVGILTVCGFFFMPVEVNRDEAWLPAYFTNLHTSAYVVLAGLACAYASDATAQSRSARRFLFGFFVFASYMLAFGWGVRSSFLALGVMYGAMFLGRKGIEPLLSVLGTAAVATTLLICAVLYEPTLYSIFDFGTSGRLSMYQEKAAFLSNYSLTDWLIGRGAGSDLMVSNIWWWEEKGSHNDFLTFLTEHGLVYLALVLAACGVTYRYAKTHEERAILCAIFITSAVSNGVLVRPAAFYALAVAVAVLGCRRKKALQPQGSTADAQARCRAISRAP